MTKHPTHAQIIAAALPLVVRHGTSVTVSMIARAAGVPAAAVFNTFPDKAALLEACATEFLRPGDAVAAVAAISLNQPLAARLASAAVVLRNYRARWSLLADTAPPRRPWRPDNPRGNTDWQARHEGELASLRDALAALFEPERDLLRMSPERLARVFQSMVLTDPLSGPADLLPTEDLVPLFLWGALAPP
ncbi:TetR/AcrR family transcriptional regulator [Streptomyces avidinii]|uniref:TetR/AcrR family transcriptional regulator n=1 Tax=Streptomyces avidinii TaxID=1895 RepID=UPI003793F2E8